MCATTFIDRFAACLLMLSADLSASGLMPLTPEGLVSPPFVADPSSYDTRYLSVSSVNMQEPGRQAHRQTDGRAGL